jgi:adenylate kinase family enzyme
MRIYFEGKRLMKVLIIGPLGAGKSSLAYAINRKFNLPRLNLDEICRNTADGGSYYPREEQFAKLDDFLKKHKDSWVSEGCQRYLYEKMQPDLIVDMRINRLVAIWRFTCRFWKAKKLIGKEIDKDLPVQAYHYRRITLEKIRDYDFIGREINAEIAEFLAQSRVPVVKCRSFSDYDAVFARIEEG